jgi:hypothetical protein
LGIFRLKKKKDKCQGRSKHPARNSDDPLDRRVVGGELRKHTCAAARPPATPDRSRPSPGVPAARPMLPLRWPASACHPELRAPPAPDAHRDPKPRRPRRRPRASAERLLLTGARRCQSYAQSRSQPMSCRLLPPTPPPPPPTPPPRPHGGGRAAPPPPSLRWARRPRAHCWGQRAAAGAAPLPRSCCCCCARAAAARLSETWSGDWKRHGRRTTVSGSRAATQQVEFPRPLFCVCAVPPFVTSGPSRTMWWQHRQLDGGVGAQDRGRDQAGLGGAFASCSGRAGAEVELIRAPGKNSCESVAIAGRAELGSWHWIEIREECAARKRAGPEWNPSHACSIHLRTHPWL